MIAAMGLAAVLTVAAIDTEAVQRECREFGDNVGMIYQLIADGRDPENIQAILNNTDRPELVNAVPWIAAETPKYKAAGRTRADVADFYRVACVASVTRQLETDRTAPVAM